MTAVSKPVAPAREAAPELQSGDRMTREEFHRIYKRMPKDFKAELVGGIVYVASPLRIRHGNRHGFLGSVLVAYEANTPGVEMGDNTTVLLSDEGEPQPDLHLRILPEHGGRSRTTKDDYLAGPPELIIEVAHASRALDLHAKKDDYRRGGVFEYIVWTLADDRLHWFDLTGNRDLAADADGVLRVRVFPGLWIDSGALFAKDYNKLMATLQQGLATPEHAAFVERLARAKS
jgi:Uma2 family endonuclease